MQNPIRGFARVEVKNLTPGDVFFITRSYWPGTSAPMAPEKKGLRYEVGEAASQTVKRTVQSIKTDIQPVPVSKKARGLLGFINDQRAEAGLERVPRLPELDKITSVWAQQISFNNEPDERLIWNADIGGSYYSFLKYQPWVSVSEFIRFELIGSGCLSYTPCVGAFFRDIDHISIAYVNGSVVTATHNCIASVCPEPGSDLGDSSLITNDLCGLPCVGGSGGSVFKKPPNLKIFYFKNNRFFKKTRSKTVIKVKSEKGARGKIVLSVKKAKKGKKLIKETGKKTNYGFIFKINKKKLSPSFFKSKKTKIFITFKGSSKWLPERLRIK